MPFIHQQTKLSPTYSVLGRMDPLLFAAAACDPSYDSAYEVWDLRIKAIEKKFTVEIGGKLENYHQLILYMALLLWENGDRCGNNSKCLQVLITDINQYHLRDASSANEKVIEFVLCVDKLFSSLQTGGDRGDFLEFFKGQVLQDLIDFKILVQTNGNVLYNDYIKKMV